MIDINTMKECILSAKHLIPDMDKTNRGFSKLEFTDKKGNECSLQMSSFAGVSDVYNSDDNDPRIWLGVANPKLVAYGDGVNIGKFINLKYPEIDGYTIKANSRMELSQSQVKELLPLLIKFAETGEL